MIFSLHTVNRNSCCKQTVIVFLTMTRMQPPTVLERERVEHQPFPVFVFPQEITFYLEDQTTYKRVLTFYNPYDNPVRFKVLSTAPSKYRVVEAEGGINARCCVDIVVRYINPTQSSCNVIDKFRVQMLHHRTGMVLGKKDIPAQLVPGSPDVTQDREHDQFQQLPVGSASQPLQQQYLLRESRQTRTASPNYVVIAVGILCSLALMLPTEGETSWAPLYLTVNFKLVLAYVLGLVTMVILRPY